MSTAKPSSIMGSWAIGAVMALALAGVSGCAVETDEPEEAVIERDEPVVVVDQGVDSPRSGGGALENFASVAYNGPGPVGEEGQTTEEDTSTDEEDEPDPDPWLLPDPDGGDDDGSGIEDPP